METKMKRENVSDFNEYPHRIFASVVLLDGKIISWKVVNYRWTKENIGRYNHPYLVYANYTKIKIRTKSFIANNTDQHNKIFQHTVKKFFKQFKIHEKFDGIKPY